MAEKVTYASGHRFHEQVAISVGNGETVYFTVKEARALSRGINKICRACERVDYGDGPNLTFWIEREK